MVRFVVFFLISLSSALCAAMSNAQTITYMGLGETRDLYNTELLTKILQQASNKKYKINRYVKDLPRPRSFTYLAENLGIDVVIAYASEERNRKYLGINIPILKGLNGWRTSVVHTDNIDLFKNVESLEQFKTYVPGQFHTWTDNKILLKNGITTVRGTNFDGLYHMLDKKRFDYFPRSILTIDHEIDIYKRTKNLAVSREPHILIKYPTAFIFYVNKENIDLAQDITTGFEAIIASGDFEDIFNKHYGKTISRIRRENRHVFSLNNPLLPKSIPVDRDELWLSY